MAEWRKKKYGVYYFWQVAEWAAADVKLMNDRLDGFTGRIQRDQWVSQAKKLSRTPSAAARPTSQTSSGEQARL